MSGADERSVAEHYPTGAIDQALTALELSYSYLRERPVCEREIRDALQRLQRAKQLHESTLAAASPPAAQEAL